MSLGSTTRGAEFTGLKAAAGEKSRARAAPALPRCNLAPYVGANLDVMDADTRRMRTTAKGLKPFVMTDLKTLAW